MPLLAGWNADEARGGVLLAAERPTATSFVDQTRKRFGPAADALLKVYPAGSDAEALESAAALASDLFIGYSTWKWIEAHRATGSAPVYRYLFSRKIPVAPGEVRNGRPVTAEDVGARHAGEIEYVFGTLDTVKNVTWTPADRTLSDAIGKYWTNFARTGNPNGDGLQAWPVLRRHARRSHPAHRTGHDGQGHPGAEPGALRSHRPDVHGGAAPRP